MIDDLTLARMIHVLSVVIWIGGIYFVTFIILPVFAKTEDAAARFEAVESQFTNHARIVVTLAGLSGFYMLYQLEGWNWFQSAEHWWLHAMACLWLIFMVVLFVAEPLFLHAWFKRQTKIAPMRTLVIVRRFHQIMAVLSLTTIAAGIYGVHG